MVSNFICQTTIFQCPSKLYLCQQEHIIPPYTPHPPTLYLLHILGSDPNLPARLVTGMKLLWLCQFHQVGGGSGRLGRSRHLPDGGGAISLVLRMEFLAVHQLGLSGSQHCNRVRQYDTNSPHMATQPHPPAST